MVTATQSMYAGIVSQAKLSQREVDSSEMCVFDA